MEAFNRVSCLLSSTTARHGGWLLLFAFPIVGCFYFVFASIYRLTLHPLAKYPGPLPGKLSGWSTLFQAIGGDRHLRSLREHQLYGPIVRISPNALSINTVSALREIYALRKPKVRKSDWYCSIASPEGHSTFNEVNQGKHNFRRRVLEQALSNSALKTAERYIINNVRLWVGLLGSSSKSADGWTSAKNMKEWSSYLSYDIMGETAFGKQFSCMESEEHRYVPDIILSSAKVAYIIGHLPCKRFLQLLLELKGIAIIAGSLGRDLVNFIEYTNKQVTQRLASEKNGSKSAVKDCIHYLFAARDPETGRGLTATELTADTSLLLTAGSDTTSTALSATIFYLIHNPRQLDKVKSEIRASFDSKHDIRDGNSVKRLVYLRACIDESLRLSPPLPSHLPREVFDDDFMLDNVHIPKGTVIGTSSYAIHHTDEYYPDPYEFRPERWIVGERLDSTINPGGISTAESVERARSAFCAFSLGPFGCPGKNMAYLELTFALATLLFSYDIRRPLDPNARVPSGEGAPDNKNPGRRRRCEYQLIDQSLSGRDGPMVEFRARET